MKLPFWLGCEAELSHRGQAPYDELRATIYVYPPLYGPGFHMGWSFTRADWERMASVLRAATLAYFGEELARYPGSGGDPQIKRFLSLLQSYQEWGGGQRNIYWGAVQAHLHQGDRLDVEVTIRGQYGREGASFNLPFEFCMDVYEAGYKLWFGAEYDDSSNGEPVATEPP